MESQNSSSHKFSLPQFTVMEQGGTFIDHIGPVKLLMEHGRATVSLVIEKQHSNPNGSAHGGLLMTLMDITLGSSAEGALSARGVPVLGHPITMQLSCSFVGAAKLGDELKVEAVVDRITKNVAFASGRVMAGDTLVMTASAVFKNPPQAKS